MLPKFGYEHQFFSELCNGVWVLGRRHQLGAITERLPAESRRILDCPSGNYLIENKSNDAKFITLPKHEILVRVTGIRSGFRV